MFTGIVDHCGQIEIFDRDERKNCLTIRSEFSDLKLGESIAVDGVCLTVIACSNTHFTVDLSPQTLRLTTALNYRNGTRVNLERSLRLADRLGGHIVTGHVDGTCQVRSILEQGDFREIAFDNFSPEFNVYLVKKGSVAINGVSLTINEVNKGSFSVMLVPHTLQITNLTTLEINAIINVEFDYLAKLVNNQMLNVEA